MPPFNKLSSSNLIRLLVPFILFIAIFSCSSGKLNETDKAKYIKSGTKIVSEVSSYINTHIHLLLNEGGINNAIIGACHIRIKPSIDSLKRKKNIQLI